MIKIMFKPFFKKFLGLFISMTFISTLSIALLISFSSSIINLTNTYKEYLTDYENIDGLIKTKFTSKEDLEPIRDIEGVKDIDFRFTMDCRMLTDSGRSITSRIYTYKKNEEGIFRRFIIDSVPNKEDKVNVSLVRKFAKNNNIKIGDTIKVGYFKMYVNLYVSEIVETPESIQVRANDYVWSDNTDFGYIYIEEGELNRALYNLSEIIDEKIKTDEEYKQYYEQIKSIVGFDIPDLGNLVFIGTNFASTHTNQILIQKEDGYTEAEVVKNVTNYLNEKGIEIKSSQVSNQLIYILYLENAIRQLRVASIFLPIFFYFVTMVIIILFINQIIKAMTKEIGIMMSVGVGFKDIRSIFILFTLIMGVLSSILGVGGGYLLLRALARTMKDVYSMPMLPYVINPYATISACIFLIIFAEVATLISTRGILRITPKDATISNEAKRRKLPKAVANFIEKAPMAMKLGVNSIFQNLRRFFISIFSIFAAYVIILLALFFNVAKTELIDQSVNRRLNFDCQVYATEVLTEETKKEIKEMDCGITAFEDCHYTYLEAYNGDEKVYLECLAFNPNTKNNLVQIPDKKGNGTMKLSESGIIIPLSSAKKLKVKVGDTLTINNKEIKIVGLSNQYFHPITYLSLEELDRLEVGYVSSLLLNINDQNKFLEEIDDIVLGSLSVFTAHLGKDIKGIFDSINLFIYIIIGFSLGMGLIILVIMSQNALMEQQRPITVYRAIGFTIMNVSNLWTLQSVSQLIISTIFALPVGSLVSIILFRLCSSANQTYPFVFSVKYAVFAFLFILFIIVLTHLISMFTIKKWNIANNTRSRE